MKRRIEYFIKHNIVLQKLFKVSLSLLFRILGIFVRVDDKLILFTGHAGRLNDSPRDIYHYMLNNSEYADYKLVWGLSKKEALNKGIKNYVVLDSFKYFITSLKSKYWIASVNIERGLKFKKKKTIYLNTWHGIPIKRIGNSAAGRKDYDFSNIDYFIVSGEYERQIYINDFKVKPNSILPIGMPRNQNLYNDLPENEKKSWKTKHDIDTSKKIILYAPTWRDSTDLGKNYNLAIPINLKKWEEQLGNEYVLLLRTHPYTTKLLNIDFNDFVRDYSQYEDVNDLIKISDILISDYSAIVFDYSITKKPMIAFTYDYEDYRKNRGIYLDLEQEFPGGICLTEDCVIGKIKYMDTKSMFNEVDRFNNKYVSYGKYAVEKSVETLLKKEL